MPMATCLFVTFRLRAFFGGVRQVLQMTMTKCWAQGCANVVRQDKGNKVSSGFPPKWEGE